MIYTTDLGDKLQQELKIAKERKVPMLLDDAAGIPPADNAKLYAKMGLDMYCFSVQRRAAGTKRLDRSGSTEFCPAGTSCVRPMKVGKEEIIGCLTALETWLKIDEKKLYAEWNGRIDRIRKLVETVPGVKTET
jgi:L-seryl-tRNA(Ser) seleniumtransferase